MEKDILFLMFWPSLLHLMELSMKILLNALPRKFRFVDFILTNSCRFNIFPFFILDRFLKPDASMDSRLQWKMFTQKCTAFWLILMSETRPREPISLTQLKLFLVLAKKQNGPWNGWVVVPLMPRELLPLLLLKEFSSLARLLPSSGWRSADWCLVSLSPTSWFLEMRDFTVTLLASCSNTWVCINSFILIYHINKFKQKVYHRFLWFQIIDQAQTELLKSSQMLWKLNRNSWLTHFQLTWLEWIVSSCVNTLSLLLTVSYKNWAVPR